AINDSAAVPGAWASRLRGLPLEPLASHISACYRDALRRHAPSRARVLLRLVVSGGSGRVLKSEVVLTTLGDRQGATCIAKAAEERLDLPGGYGGGLKTLRVSFRLVAE